MGAHRLVVDHLLSVNGEVDVVVFIGPVHPPGRHLLANLRQLRH
jgi:hypothetical protein